MWLFSSFRCLEIWAVLCECSRTLWDIIFKFLGGMVLTAIQLDRSRVCKCNWPVLDGHQTAFLYSFYKTYQVLVLWRMFLASSCSLYCIQCGSTEMLYVGSNSVWNSTIISIFQFIGSAFNICKHLKDNALIMHLAGSYVFEAIWATMSYSCLWQSPIFECCRSDKLYPLLVWMYLDNTSHKQFLQPHLEWGFKPSQSHPDLNNCLPHKMSAANTPHLNHLKGFYLQLSSGPSS